MFKRILVVESFKYLDKIFRKYEIKDHENGYVKDKWLISSSQTLTHIVNFLWYVVIRSKMKIEKIIRVGTCGSYFVKLGEKVVAASSNSTPWNKGKLYPDKTLLKEFINRDYKPVHVYTKDLIFVRTPKNVFDKYQCVDMETSGLYFFGKRFKIPTLSLSVVSDKMGKKRLNEKVLQNKVSEVIEDVLST